MKNEEECVCSVCLFRYSIFIDVRIIKEMQSSVASGTTCIYVVFEWINYFDKPTA
jgi:hypothetical protein